jgi:molybdopterin-binding protein
LDCARKPGILGYRRAVSAGEFRIRAADLFPSRHAVIVALFSRAYRAGISLGGFAMRISARNQLKGTVVDVKKGATTSHVRVDIGNGQIVTSSITNEAVDELGIKVKGHVTVVVKASDVMIAVD